MPLFDVRRPAVAGRFYEGNQLALRKEIEDCFLHPLGPGQLPDFPVKQPRTLLGLVSPHAGYMFSGPPAARAYLELAREKPPDLVVILGTKHRSEGPDLSVWGGGPWVTPLGEVQVDRRCIEALTSDSHLFQLDASAHYGEHAEEVQLPFLQFIYGDHAPPVVPVSYGADKVDTILQSGQRLASALIGRSALIIASTDLSHYEPQAVAHRKDRLALDRIEALDAEGLLQVVRDHRISMCGYAATAAMLTACKELGATRAEILGYSTSGDILNDPSSVVGYAAAVIRKGS
ncbi:MAG: AmmeMemoRadiSam system protein B [Armatimonadetes bacterium]|nr:AmmeMemoRadiSam system protein B [Armatimonadota bacterium]